MNDAPPGVIPLKKKGCLSWLHRDQKNERTETADTATTMDETGIATANSAGIVDDARFAAMPLTATRLLLALEEVEVYPLGEIPAGDILACAKPKVIVTTVTGGKIASAPALFPVAEAAVSKTLSPEEAPAAQEFLLPSSLAAPLPSTSSPFKACEPVTSASAARVLMEPTLVDGIAAKDPGNRPASFGSWFQHLKEGLSHSSSRLTQGIVALFTKRHLDNNTLEELEELLITADLGVTTAARLVANLAKTRFNQEISPEEVQAALAADIGKILEPVAQPLVIDRSAHPYVILVVGVNGSGKTTTIGKIARQLCDDGLQVSLAAGDTFRAAAVEQLKIWGERSGCSVVTRITGADAAGLAFDALSEARARKDDVLLIDTAGRLQNKVHLMAELKKIIRVLRKLEPAAPHACLLVLDATVGQNAHSQVEIFRQTTSVSGLVVTKLDGTARGGVLVALAEKFRVPVHYVGVGEKVEDLCAFSAQDFARSLLGLDA